MDRKRINIPDDMLMEIFSRLPSKSLLRFGCLSKNWYSILTHFYQKKLPSAMIGFFCSHVRGFHVLIPKPIFIRLHNINSNSIIDTDLSFLPVTHKIHVMDCCNGLILCCGTVRDFYVCNPATCQWFRMPYFPTRSLAVPILVFEPRLSNHYTVVQITINPPPVDDLIGKEMPAEVHIYYSATGKWVRDQYECAPSCGGIFNLFRIGKFTIYIDGAIHLFDLPKKCVWIFDLEEKIVHKIYLPQKFHNDECSMRFGKCGGRLHYGAATKDGRLSVWVLENHLWVQKHDADDLQPGGKILAFHPDMDVVFLEMGRDTSN